MNSSSTKVFIKTFTIVYTNYISDSSSGQDVDVQKLSNRLKKVAFLLHKSVSIVSPLPVNIPSPEHHALKLSRAINLTTCHWLCAHHALVLFAPIQGHVGLVSEQMLAAVGEGPILSLGALVLPLHGLRNREQPWKTMRQTGWLFGVLSLHLPCHSICAINGVSNSSRENAGGYKHVAAAYGRMKLQNQSKEKALPNHMSSSTPGKDWGESKVRLKHAPTSAAPGAPSSLRFEPGCGG